MTNYRIVERTLHNGTMYYVIQRDMYCGGPGYPFTWVDVSTFIDKVAAIAERDRLKGFQIKSEKEIK